MPKDGSKAGKSTEKKPRGPGVKFKKNDPATGFRDERINRTGRQAVFAPLRAAAMKILTEQANFNGSDGKQITMDGVEQILRWWLVSRDGFMQNRLLEIGFGKVPDELNVHSDIDEFIRNNLDLFTDGQLKRLTAGEDGLSILAEVVREALGKKK